MRVMIRYRGSSSRRIQECVFVRRLVDSNFDYEVRLFNGTEVYIWKDELICFKTYLNKL